MAGRRKRATTLGLTSGLALDINSLIMRFVAMETVRYEEFSKLWRELNFPLIFCGLRSTTFERKFTTEAFSQAQKFVLPPMDLQRRIGAMYVLYGLFYTQPCNPPVKIRVNLELWLALTNLFCEVKEQGHLDAAFVFMKMRRSKAFHFVSVDKPAVYTRFKTEDSYEKWKTGKDLVQSTFDPDLLEQLHSVHNQYQEMKQDLNLQDNLSMRLVRESMADFIVQRIHAHQGSDEDEDESENEPEANPTQERAARLAQLKQKSLSTQGKAPRSQRHVGQASASSATEDNESPLKRGKNGRRKRGRVGPRRKPGARKYQPATELEKKKAWAILPMRKLEEPEDVEKEADDEDSDQETQEPEKARKKRVKSTNTNSKAKKRKKEKKPPKSKKTKNKEAIDNSDSAHAASLDPKEPGSPKKAGSPKKQGGRRERRSSSRIKKQHSNKEAAGEPTDSGEPASEDARVPPPLQRGGERKRKREMPGKLPLSKGSKALPSGCGSRNDDDAGLLPKKRGRSRPRKRGEDAASIIGGGDGSPQHVTEAEVVPVASGSITASVDGVGSSANKLVEQTNTPTGQASEQEISSGKESGHSSMEDGFLQKNLISRATFETRRAPAPGTSPLTADAEAAGTADDSSTGPKPEENASKTPESRRGQAGRPRKRGRPMKKKK